METRDISIAFFSNFLNHHQVYVADELYAITNGRYTFVELEPMPDSFKKSGYSDFSDRPYLLQAWKDEISEEKAHELAVKADIFIKDTNNALPYLVERLKSGEKISFEASERWFKKGLLNILSPRFVRWFIAYNRYYRNKPIYKLCSSAFTSRDMNMVCAFKNRCYKWGYFTEVTRGENVFKRNNVGYIRLLWCSRFIEWKHPELAIKLAKRLKENGYAFKLDMVGGGLLIDKMRNFIDLLNLRDSVSILGNLPNEKVREEFKKHDIFLFTSDKNEGWGAVANEAMSLGCVLVGSDEIGSIPFLVKNGVNGMVFRSGDIDSLYSKVTYLINNPRKREEISLNGINTIRNVWSPQKAAENFYNLANALYLGQPLIIKEGPCSIAEII